MPALPSSILEPLWVQFAALLPTRQVHHPLGCHRRRIPDRVIFDKLIQVLVFAAATAGSPITPARRPRCAAAVTSGSSSALSTGSDVRYLTPTIGCSGWNWTTWRWTAASPRHPAAARPPGPARSTAASRGLSAPR
jgi:transposase